MFTSGVSGSWTAEGRSEYCTISGTGGFGDGALDFVLRLDTEDKTCGFEWAGLYDTRASASCPWGVDAHDVHTAISDQVLGKAWDPENPWATLSGSNYDPPGGPGDMSEWSYSWSLSPLD